MFLAISDAALRSAQAKAEAASVAKAVAQSLSAPTWAGAVRWVVDPSPSWPKLSEPQDQRVPSCLRAKEWLKETETAAQSVALPTFVGACLSAVSPSQPARSISPGSGPK